MDRISQVCVNQRTFARIDPSNILGELSEAQARLRSIKVKLDSDWAVSFVLALPRPIVRFLLSEKVRLSRNEMLCFVSNFR